MADFDYKTFTPEEFRKQLPRASRWVLEQERFILGQGVPLTSPQRADAKLAGVAFPAKVRLLRVREIPMPEHSFLRAGLEAMKLNTSLTPGLALRYGIFIRSEYWGQRWYLVHEFAHTGQYERLGSVRAFIECFLFQCLAVGYPSAPMEQEAILMAQRICGPSPAPRATPVVWQTGPMGTPPIKGRRPHR